MLDVAREIIQQCGEKCDEIAHMIVFAEIGYLFGAQHGRVRIDSVDFLHGTAHRSLFYNFDDTGFRQLVDVAVEGCLRHVALVVCKLLRGFLATG